MVRTPDQSKPSFSNICFLLGGKPPPSGIEFLGVIQEKFHLLLPIIILEDGNVVTLQAEYVLIIGCNIVGRPVGGVRAAGSIATVAVTVGIVVVGKVNPAVDFSCQRVFDLEIRKERKSKGEKGKRAYQ